MKVYILLALFCHSTIATIDLQQLKDTATTQLHTITDKATSSLKDFADTIDFQKVQKLDILNILPKLQYKGKLIKDTFDSIPEYSQKVRSYLQRIKSLSGKDLVPSFDVPWPAKKRIYYDGYYHSWAPLIR